jgi:UrcA family protein
MALRVSHRSLNMKHLYITAVATALALSAGSAAVAAENLGEVSIHATRMITSKVVGRTSSGVPIEEVTLSHQVTSAGLDIASHSGAMEFEKRIADAASSACKELGEKFPNVTQSDAACAKAAAEPALAQARELEAAARRPVK